MMKHAKRVMTVLTAALWCPLAQAAEPKIGELVGHWAGKIRLPAQELPFDLDFLKGEAGITGDISIPLQGVKDSPITDVKLSDGMYSFKFPLAPGNATFQGVLNEDGSIAGELLQGGQRFPFAVARAKTEGEAVAEGLKGFDDAAERIRATWKAPGLSVVIVKGTEVVHAAGYGKRDVEGDLPVTTKTLFAIGSSTKAFTTFVMGTLVDERKLEFDKPVIEMLPDFRMKDETATKLMTPRDLVTHRSGLPRHDVMWYNSGLTRQQMYERLRYLEPNQSFRGAWQYNNLMFLTAGYLVERVSGKTWEENVRSPVFEPLAMTRSNFSVKQSAADADHAEPYSEKDDVVKRIPFRDIAEIGPAGSINSCADDLASWLIVHLNDGKFAGHELIRSVTLKELHSPQMVMGGEDSSKTTGVVSVGYAMGWMVDVYRGHRRVQHGGNIDGFSAAVMFFPDDGIGIAALTNMNASPVPELVAQVASDRLLGLEARDWSSEGRVKYEVAKSMVKEGEKKRDETRIANAPATHPLAEYAGEYEHPAYGVVTVAASGDRLELTINHITFPFEHWHYDVFSGQETESEFIAKGMKAQFLMNVRGDIDRLELPLEPMVKPAVFTRRPDSSLSDPAFLAKLAGEYQLAGATLRISADRGGLRLFVPGQPEYELEPTRNNTFKIKILDGYLIRFVMNEDGTVKELQADQPNGLFIAKPK